MATSPDEVEKYASCTMLAASLLDDAGDSSQLSTQEVTGGAIDQCINFLEENEFIRYDVSYIDTF